MSDEEIKSLLTDDEIKQMAKQLKGDDLVATVGMPLKAGDEKASREEVINVLKEIYDPEIPINIYDLGLIYKIELSENGNVYIEMTLTTPTCPIAGEMPTIVATSLAYNDKVGEVTVRIVWEPAWDLTRLSDEAKDILEMIK